MGETNQKLDQCRLCTKYNAKTIAIYSEKGAFKKLHEKIEKYLPIMVTKDDSLPQNSCLNCASAIFKWHEFVNACIDAEKTLKDSFTEENCKQENIQLSEGFGEDRYDSSDNEDNAELITIVKEEVVVEEDTKYNINTKEITIEPHSCTICGKLCKFNCLLKRHLSTDHGIEQKISTHQYRVEFIEKCRLEDKKSFKCPDCPAILFNANSLTRHCSVRTKETKPKENVSNICTICGNTYKHRNSLQRHIQQDHEAKKNDISTAEDDDNKKNSNLKLRKVSKRVRENKPFACSICDMSYKNKYNLNQHLRLIHGNKNNSKLKIEKVKITKEEFIKKYRLENKTIQCPECPLITNISNFFRHYNSHKEAKYFVENNNTRQKLLYKCTVCDKSYQKENLVSHLEKRHGIPKPKRATSRHKAFVDSCTLENGNMKCPKCHYVTHKRSYFIRHYTVTHGEKKFCCHKCGKYVRTVSNLKTHIQEVHERLRKFPCDMCDKKFLNKPTLAQHRNIHLDLRPYVCEICGKAYRHQGGLHSHKVWHTGKRKYECPICAKTFTKSQSLKNHKLIHTGEKPHSCPQCASLFRYKSTLRKHLKNHHRLMPCTCPICGNVYKQERLLNLHMRRHTAVV